MTMQANIAAALARLVAAVNAVNARVSAGGAVPVAAASDFVVPANTQALFAEPITLAAGASIEVQAGAVLREVA